MLNSADQLYQHFGKNVRKARARKEEVEKEGTQGQDWLYDLQDPQSKVRRTTV